MDKIYLASKSPRRQMLLKQINVDFETIDSEIDESVIDNEEPLNYVRRMSIEKVTEAWNSTEDLCEHPILAADTSIAVNNSILGKPVSKDDAFNMLTILSDKIHQVITSVSVLYHQRQNLNDATDSDFYTGAGLGADTDIGITKIGTAKINTINSITNVNFMKLSNQDIKEYLETNEWKDKAGSYAIQGYAAKYIKAIEGSYTGVVGLPLHETSQLLNQVRVFYSKSEL